MADEQYDLFDDVWRRAVPLRPGPEPRAIDPAGLSDEELVGGLGDSRIADCLARIREIGRRRLEAGISSLEALCLRHAGFNRARTISEQAAAIEAMLAIGGADAAAAIGRLVARRIIDGPGLKLAFSAAAFLGSPLPEAILAQHLRNDDPEIRAAAAGCVGVRPRLAPTLVELLDDLHGQVRIAAACALGRMGGREARAVLVRALQEDPTAEVIDASAGIGDEEIIVLLGRIAARSPDLSAVAMDALGNIDHPRADKVLAGLGRSPAEGENHS